MNKRIVLSWLIVIGMITLALPISQANAKALVASPGPKTSPDHASPAQASATARHKWRVVASPNPGTSSNALNAIMAISASDAWAAGYYDFFLGTLSEHYS